MMNLRYAPLLGTCLVILSLLSGCIKGDSAPACGSQGIDVYFYSRSLCESDTVYPQEIQDILLALFDKENKLVNYTRNTLSELHSEYFQQMEVGSGLYTVIAWSGIDGSDVTIEELHNGTTDKNDLLFRIQREAERAYDLSGDKIFYGESDAFYIEENQTADPLFEKVYVNMLEVTNRITISVEGLAQPDLYQILIESNAGSMNIDGTLASDDTLQYIPNDSEETDPPEATFTLLKLSTGYENTIVIRDTTSGTEIYRGSLLGALILKNPEVNLACDHDFTIRFTAENPCDCGTYVITEIHVNEWLVHSYETEM